MIFFGYLLRRLLRGRSQLSTFMRTYTAYARGRGSGTTERVFPRKSTFNFNHWQCIIKYATCPESGQYAHICRSFVYNITFEALFLMSKCTQSDFLWMQTVAPHRGFYMAAQRSFRSAYADYSTNRTKPRIVHQSSNALCHTIFYNKKLDIRNARNNEKADSAGLIRGLQRPLAPRGSNVHF